MKEYTLKDILEDREQFQNHEIQVYKAQCVDSIIESLSIDKNDNIFLKGRYTDTTLCINLNSKFNKVRQPVSFKEVLNTNAMVRCEHKLVDKVKSIGSSKESIVYGIHQALKRDDFMQLNDLFIVLSWMLTPKEIREIIKNGKWYLED